MTVWVDDQGTPRRAKRIFIHDRSTNPTVVREAHRMYVNDNGTARLVHALGPVAPEPPENTDINGLENLANYDMAAEGVVPGSVWTVPLNFWVWSQFTSNPALLMNVANVTVINNGNIVGRGGTGNGGAAIRVTAEGCTIQNNVVTGSGTGTTGGAYIAGGGGQGAQGRNGNVGSGAGGGGGPSGLGGSATPARLGQIGLVNGTTPPAGSGGGAGGGAGGVTLAGGAAGGQGGYQLPGSGGAGGGGGGNGGSAGNAGGAGARGGNDAGGPLNSSGGGGGWGANGGGNGISTTGRDGGAAIERTAGLVVTIVNNGVIYGSTTEEI